MKPLVRFVYVKPKAEVAFSRAGASRQALDEEARNTTYWINELYQVARRVIPGTPMVQLNIRRCDGGRSFGIGVTFKKLGISWLAKSVRASNYTLPKADWSTLATSTIFGATATLNSGFRVGLITAASRMQIASATGCLVTTTQILNLRGQGVLS